MRRRLRSGLLIGCALLVAATAGAQRVKRPEAVVQGRPIGAWASDLGGKELLPRLRAVQALTQAGPEARAAAPALVAVFRDRDAPLLHPLAAVALARVGGDALPALEPALTHDAETVRGGAALALGLMGAKARPVVPRLTQALGDGSALVRQAAAQALGRIGAAARSSAGALREALRDADAGVRVEAAAALWQVGGESTGILVLTTVLKMPDRAILPRALAALAEMGPRAKSAAPAVRELLRDKEASVRIAAAETLYRVSEEVEAPLRVLETAATGGDLADRRAAVAALGTLGGAAKAVAVLKRLRDAAEPEVRREAACALSVPLDGGLSDADAGVRWWSAVALAGSSVDVRKQEETLLRALRAALRRVGDGEPEARLVLDVQAPHRAAPALARVVAGSSPRLRLEAARLLAGLGVDVRPATTELRQAAEGDDKRLQQAACAALATLGLDAVPRSAGERPRQREAWARLVGHVGLPARSLTGRLRELLTDPDAPVRTQAALALWRVDGQADAALPVLTAVLKDVDNPERWEAIEAIGTIAVEARPPIRGITEVLVRALEDRDVRVRLVAARWLWRRSRDGKAIVPLLRDGLADRDPFARLSAVETLGELDPETRAAPLLAAALADRDVGVRLAASEGLARGGSDNVALLTELLGDRRVPVRVGAAQALAWIGRPATDALGGMVTNAEAVVRTAGEEGLFRLMPDDAATVRELMATLRQISRASGAERTALTTRRDELKRRLLGGK